MIRWDKRIFTDGIEMSFVAIDHTLNFAIDALAKAADMQQMDQNIDALHAHAVGTTYTLNPDGHIHDETDGAAASWSGVPVYDVFSNFSPVSQWAYAGPSSGPDTGWIVLASYEGWIRAGAESFTFDADVTGNPSNGAKFRIVQIPTTGTTDVSNEVDVTTLDVTFTLAIVEDNRNKAGTVQVQVKHETPVSSIQSKLDITSGQQFQARFN